MPVGSNWDVLFARDREGWILKRMAEAVDGEFQKLSATDGHYNREHFFSRYPELAALVANMSDQDIDALKRGGHDPAKVYAAYAAAVAHRGQPTVILAQTTGVMAWVPPARVPTPRTRPRSWRAKTSAASASASACPCPTRTWKSCATSIPARTATRCATSSASRRARRPCAVAAHRGASDPVVEARYLCGLPRRFGRRSISTTMTLVRLLNKLMRDSQLGPRIVPVVADEARTFGMQDMFRQYGIYSPWGQNYTPAGQRPARLLPRGHQGPDS